jgi:succinoglycan biosynthesis protein ExoO
MPAPTTASPEPRVSFLTAAYNAAPYVEAAVRSALGQTGVSVEVIVVDDASQDDTAARVAAMARTDPRVRLLANAHARGPSGARNTALEAARGDWVAVLDADDLIEPERSATLLRLAEENGSDIVADNVVRFLDAEPATEWRMLPTAGALRTLRIGLTDYLDRNRMLRGDANLGYLKPMVRRRFALQNGVRYDETLRIGEDFDFCLRCLAAGGAMAVASEPFYRYRMLEGSLSRQLSAADIDTLLGANDRAAARPALQAAGVRPAVRTYRRSLLDARDYFELRRGLRERDLGTILRSAVRPRVWLTAARLAYGAGRRRLAQIAGTAPQP